MNDVIEKVKTWCKLSYIVFEEQRGYYPLMYIYTFTALIKFEDFLDGIQHCVIVVGKWIFDSNINFALPLICDDLDYCCTNDDEEKEMNGYKVVLKAI